MAGSLPTKFIKAEMHQLIRIFKICKEDCLLINNRALLGY